MHNGVEVEILLTLDHCSLHNACPQYLITYSTQHSTTKPSICLTYNLLSLLRINISFARLSLCRSIYLKLALALALASSPILLCVQSNLKAHTLSTTGS